jgi:RHH-type proline utilization regulon transcriptional repressor/proline dehydrogenase/delta 1-pyrroline-5-carboxylate dehydrogenase
LENGANSSFVAKVGDPTVPIRTLLARPGTWLEHGAAPTHPAIKKPVDLYGTRRNSSGLEFGDRQALSQLLGDMNDASLSGLAATPLVDGRSERAAHARPVCSPTDGTVVGGVVEASMDEARAAMATAARAVKAIRAWPVEARAVALEKMADLIEARRARLIALLAVEAGKTLPDALAEVREAADFCRYYASEARRVFGADHILAGPTGEENRYRHRGRGVFVAISPWNFPLAIFLGQVTAALAAGNVVVAKPAPQTPLIAFEAVKLLFEAGVPTNAVHFVPGGGGVGGGGSSSGNTGGAVGGSGSGSGSRHHLAVPLLCCAFAPLAKGCIAFGKLEEEEVINCRTSQKK